MILIMCSGGCGASIDARGVQGALNMTYTCAHCAPQDERADAVGVSRKSIPAEVRDYAKRSSASAPNDTPLTTRDRETIAEIESSSGTQVFRLRDGFDGVAADDAIERRGERAAPPPSDKKPHSPFGPQSLSHAGVFNPANKEAPYGYDDEGRPIRVLKTGFNTMFRGCEAVPPAPTPEEAERRRKRKLEQEKERADRERELAAKREREYEEKLERLTHLPEFAGMKGLPTKKSNPSGNLSGWGAERRAVTPLPPIPVGDFDRPRPPYYRELLGLSRQQLAELLNISLGEVTHTFVDVTQPKTKRIKSRMPVEVELKWLSRHTEELQNDVKKLSEKIAALDEEITQQERIRHGLKKPVMKRVRDPDNIPDDAYLKKLRHDVDGEIEKLNAQRDALLDQRKKHKEEIKSIPSRVQAQQDRLNNWDTLLENIIEEYPTATYRLPVLFGDVFVVPKEDNFRGRVPQGYTYGDDAAGAFCQMVYESKDDADFKYWRRFENAVIVQAIEHRLLPPPSEEILRKFHSEHYYRITKQQQLDPTDDHDEVDVDHSAEEDIIKKTSGGAIGGRIFGGGVNWDGTLRRLSSFDRSIAFGGGREGGGDGGDDHTEAQGPDDEEPMTPS